ncbi:carbohydrate-binding module family 50 protein [Cylindrobasidium torrendii FP15055 ss-10]|uniref:Carbohydrate-binding module family 50 protein n=1 Tax=Cylindrobasidium torrendii FP15055 ss-10 TaxID=1314674 RepID=A0A0D7B1M6_9AGAR|nr:carbohydrate-binding module family 50 protein [Cylindrobasidium torrendii FP15055 ss-10]
MFANFVLTSIVGAVVAAAQSIECARNYTVHLGDVCDTISASQNSSTYQLAHVNPNIDEGCTNLALGEPLCLGEVGHDCQDTYVISSGDGCWAISQTFGIGLDILLANNPNVASDCSNIYPNEASFGLADAQTES